MSDAPQPSPEPPQTPRRKEFEDPHFHDDDELPADEEGGRGARPTGPRRPARRVMPPRRRHYED